MKARITSKRMSKKELHTLVDQLPDQELHTARKFLEYLRDTSDPLLKSLREAPEDDEPLTPEEREALAESKRDIKEGQSYTHEEIMKKYGLAHHLRPTGR